MFHLVSGPGMQTHNLWDFNQFKKRLDQDFLRDDHLSKCAKNASLSKLTERIFKNVQIRNTGRDHYCINEFC